MMTIKLVIMAAWIGFFNGGGIQVTKITNHDIDSPYQYQYHISYYGEKPGKSYIDSEYMNELSYNSEENSWN